MALPFDLRQLRYLVAVAESGSFRAAAERLHVSQPPLSRQVADLERTLGARLFDRHAGGVTLTPAGRVALAGAQALLAQAQSLSRAIAAEARSGAPLPHRRDGRPGRDRSRTRHAGVARRACGRGGGCRGGLQPQPDPGPQGKAPRLRDRGRAWRPRGPRDARGGPQHAGRRPAFEPPPRAAQAHLAARRDGPAVLLDPALAQPGVPRLLPALLPAASASGRR